ncbi:MAG: RluA family pseudouridine synthase [Archangium gephyra]|uniref:Pseudouridine synthase n=1 Tax=Archangium gephyra TaxID=48 RepID=A0A2W5TRZ5_9BACT|nr:MAG: RluA family pseudouridine synthase [Archangium gephyra]
MVDVECEFVRSGGGVARPEDELDQLRPDEAGIVRLRYTVEPNYAGWRLDKYLCEKIRRASRTRVQEIIENDVVYERKLKPSTPVWPGLTFEVRRRVREEPTVPHMDALTQVFMDDALLVLDKPPGLPIHPTARYHHNTLVEQVKKKYGEGFRADPAHRLDRETSGLVVCGRTLEACQRLMKAFHDGKVNKEYVAVVEGWPEHDEFVVDAPIAEGTELIRIAVRIDESGRSARTRFVVQKRFERDGAKFAVLRCLPETGRQHQIRIHAQHVGFPLVGDKMYGPDPGYFDRFSKKQLEPEAWVKLRLPRQALHAATLELPHPTTRERVKFEAPLAKDLRDFIDGKPVSGMGAAAADAAE